LIGCRDRLGKRALGEGVLRSAIVLYNEEHPHGYALAQLAAKDMRKYVGHCLIHPLLPTKVLCVCVTAHGHRRPDCLIIMGTSLKVVGCKRLVRDMVRRRRWGASAAASHH
jgi:NAD+-dependent protein deacetylase SIR2